MSRHDHLNRDVMLAGQGAHHIQQGVHDPSLPLGMQVGLDLINQEDDFLRGIGAQELQIAEVFLPRPDEEVSQRDNALIPEDAVTSGTSWP